jgi:hypothetical protein
LLFVPLTHLIKYASFYKATNFIAVAGRADRGPRDI